MSVVRTLIGNVKGPKGDTGSQGPQGVAGTIEIGSVQTVSYGSPASVTNSGTEEEAILDFQIPQGAPGAQVTDMSNLVLSTITDSTADYPTFAVSETGSTIFGKIRKFLSDLKSNYVSKAMMTTSTNIDTPGQAVADAKAIKSLNDSFANYLPTTDIAATYATKSETLRANIIRTSVASGQTLAAGDWKDYNTGVTITGNLVAYIAQYSGNPKCIIANMWTSATNTAMVTIYNPSSAAMQLGEIRILELYKN